MNLVNSGDGQVGLREAEDHGDSCLDVHVVILNNYLRKHHVASYRALAKRVRKLTVLHSVPMESDRAWDADWKDLDVHVQRNWMVDADDQASIMGAIERALAYAPSELLAMGVAAKRSVHEINENATSTRFCEVIQAVWPGVNSTRPRSRTYKPLTNEVVPGGIAGHLAR
ncbi:MAG: hypothetical protein ACI814_004104 [Mariniblastus sp.]|jgi:hypothetical protein